MSAITTIVMSGGHLTPAWAMMEYFRRHHPEVRLVFVGRQYSQEKEGQLAREKEVAEKFGIPFHFLPAAKFHRQHWWRNIEELPKLLPSYWKAFRILQQERASLFLSFGGYLAVPLAMSAKILGIPVVTHEQTATSGLANEFIAKLADKVAISVVDSQQRFPKHKTILTGNPVRESLQRDYSRRPAWVPESSKPLIYITGGSQGSQVINTTVAQILPELTRSFRVIHQCGESPHNHYLTDLEKRADLDLSVAARSNYVAREWIDDRSVSWILQHAHLVIGRSGANTVQEILIHSVPAIFIPLPFAHNNEQMRNAQQLSEAGAAITIEQKDLTPDSLLSAIQSVKRRRATMHRAAAKLRHTQENDGAEKLADLCLSLLS